MRGGDGGFRCGWTGDLRTGGPNSSSNSSRAQGCPSPEPGFVPTLCALLGGGERERSRAGRKTVDPPGLPPSLSPFPSVFLAFPQPSSPFSSLCVCAYKYVDKIGTIPYVRLLWFLQEHLISLYEHFIMSHSPHGFNDCNLMKLQKYNFQES